jgi:hypothetical protein
VQIQNRGQNSRYSDKGSNQDISTIQATPLYQPARTTAECIDAGYLNNQPTKQPCFLCACYISVLYYRSWLNHRDKTAWRSQAVTSSPYVTKQRERALSIKCCTCLLVYQIDVRKYITYGRFVPKTEEFCRFTSTISALRANGWVKGFYWINFW